MSTNPLEVSGCFIQSKDRCLFVKRHHSKPFGLTWSLPAGKVEPHEDFKQALLREVKEETSIEIPNSELSFIKTFVNLNRVDSYNFHVYHWYTEKQLEVALPLDELIDYKWVTLSELSRIELIPGGPELIEELKEMDSLPHSLSLYFRS